MIAMVGDSNCQYPLTASPIQHPGRFHRIGRLLPAPLDRHHSADVRADLFLGCGSIDNQWQVARTETPFNSRVNRNAEAANV